MIHLASNKGLGKGLGALLGDFSEEPIQESAYRELPIYKVEPFRHWRIPFPSTV